MKHQAERDAGIPCANKNCMWWADSFTFNCRGYQDNYEKTLSPKPSCCHEYEPVRQMISNQWLPVTSLPPVEDDEYDHRCIVVWQDYEHPQDQGVEVCTLSMIRDGDYEDHGRIRDAHWYSLRNAPPIKKALAGVEQDG